jgi:hypothetical protein
MRIVDRAYGALKNFAGLLAHGRQHEFTCGDCDRWQRCGLPPDGNCIARAAQMEQLARDGGYRMRRAKIVSSGASWIYDRGGGTTPPSAAPATAAGSLSAA